MSNFYPVYLNLQGQKCLVVGGGKVASRKVQSLVSHGAVVTVISPVVEKDIAEWADEGKILWVRREFTEKDMEEVFLVVSATDNDVVNRQVADGCLARRILVNVVDDPEKCNFIVPAVVRRGPLSISISTDGKSPLLSRRLRERLEKQFGMEYADFLEIMGEVRERARREVNDLEDRRRIFTELVDSDLIELLGDGKHKLVKERIESVFASRRSKP